MATAQMNTRGTNRALSPLQYSPGAELCPITFSALPMSVELESPSLPGSEEASTRELLR